MIGVGGMIGAAIFIFPGTTGVLAGPASILAWFFTGVLMMIIALVYVELARRYPESGGPVLYPYFIFGRALGREIGLLLSYLEGLGFIIGWLIAVVVSSLCIPSYLSYIAPGLGERVVPIAALSIILASLVNVMGVRRTGRANLVLTSLLLAGITVFIAAGLARGLREPCITVRDVLPRDIGGFLASIGLAVGAYGAWVGIAAVAGEVRDPGRNVTRAIIASLALVTAVYTLMVTVLHLNVPQEEFKFGSSIVYSPISYAMERITSAELARITVGFTALVAIFTTMIVGVMSLSRAVYALSRLGLAPKALAELSGEGNAPLKAIMVTTIVALALACFPSMFFKMIVIGMVVGTNIPYAINIAGYLLESGREKKVKGVILSLLALLAMLTVTISLSRTELWASLAALTVLLLVYPLLRLPKLLGSNKGT